MGKLSRFQLRNNAFVLLLGEFAGVIVQYGLCGLGRGGVKKDDRCHVLAEGGCDAGQLLGQHSHADADMTGRKAEIHQLARAPFHVFRDCAVIEDDERVRALKIPANKLQLFFQTVLRAHDHKHLGIIFTKAIQGHVVHERVANKHDAVELATEWPE